MDEKGHVTGGEAAGERPAQPDEPAAGAAIDEERLRAALDELRRLRVEDLAQEMMVTLVTVGYQKLGLTEQTRALRDVGDARLAIELLRACIDALARERGETGLEALRSTLDAMQLDYARAVMTESGRGEAAQEQAAEPGPAEASAQEEPARAEAAEEEPPDEAPADEQSVAPQPPETETPGAGGHPA